MVEISEAMIKEIADDLECGMRCFYNMQTGELKSVPDLNSWPGTERELWEDIFEEIDENYGDYLRFERLSPNESFNVMMDFTEFVHDARLRNKLQNALSRPKPFKNFKWIVENSLEYRNKWFTFRDECNIDWVRLQLKQYNECLGREEEKS